MANNGQTGCAVIAWWTDGQTPCDVTVSPDGGSIERLLWTPPPLALWEVLSEERSLAAA